MEQSKIVSIKKIDNDSLKYNIETDLHNYFANNVLVHNCDGSSSSFIFHKNRFIIASRNFTKYNKPFKTALKELTPDSGFKRFSDDFIKVACKYRIPYVFKTLQDHGAVPKNFALQGELCGPAIQKNKMGLSDLTLFAFNVFDSDKRKYLSPLTLKKFEAAGIPMVPFIEIKNFDWESISDLEEYAKGKYDNGHPREGVVIRRWDEGCEYLSTDQKNNMISFKIINPDFALKERD